MTTFDIASTLQSYAQAKNDHDVDAILSLCAPECRYESVALGSAVQGKPALRDFYSALFHALPDYTAEFEGTAVGTDSAVVWGRFSGTLSDNFMGSKVERGRRIDVPVSFVCEFVDGLLVADRGYFDAATLAEQIGLPLEAIRPTSAERAAQDEDQAADSFVERFQAFWSSPDPDKVTALIAPDAVASWPGTKPIRGNEYPQQIASILALVPDLRLHVTEHVEAGELTFISWRAQATVNGEPLTWTGIDRFRVRDARAVEVLVVYDTMPLVDAIRRSRTAASSAG